MASLPAQLVVALNRLFPAPALPGDVDPMDYAEWEYRTSEAAVRLWRQAEGGRVDRALDLGCGLGGKTHRLAEVAGPQVRWSALDIAEAHLREARRFHRKVGRTNVHTLAGDAAALPFADASFDRIVSADALEHLPRPREALREVHRCLRPDGRFVLLFNPWGSARGSHLADLVHLPWCQLVFSRDTLVEATRRIGERRARRVEDPAEAARMREHTASLVDHFVHHVHPTRIADLRQWIREDRTFEIESELHVGPGPLRDAAWVGQRWSEEWLSATYGGVLRRSVA